MKNYYNTLSEKNKSEQLGVCDFMGKSEFINGTKVLEGLKIVIIGCGAQGLNQGLNMRDSGLNISYTLRAEAIEQKRQSYRTLHQQMEKVDYGRQWRAMVDHDG